MELFSPNKRVLRLIFFIILTAGPAVSVTNAQILRDTTTLSMVKRCIDNIYNFQFSNGEEIYAKIRKSYPQSPIMFLLKGMMTYWENYPLITTSAARGSFEKDLRTCIDLCDKSTDTLNQAEFLLANLCARGLLLLFYSDNDLSREVIPLAANTYKYIRRSFDYTNSYSDFSYFTGLYNYYREAYPEAHPVYKPLTSLFPKGDRKKGLKELQTAAGKSIVLKAESSSFLSYIYLSFEKNYPQAVFFSQSLHERYPLNQQYLGELIRNLLLVRRYDDAEKVIAEDAPKADNKYFRAQLSIFNGILQEKKYKNLKSAQQYYNKGIADLIPYGAYGEEMASVGYMGLSRIAAANGDKHGSNSLRKKGMDLTSFKTDPFEN